jgi:hypothetical protein
MMIHDEIAALEQRLERGELPLYLQQLQASATPLERWHASATSRVLQRVFVRAVSASSTPARRRQQVLGLLRDELSELGLDAQRLRARGAPQLAEQLEHLRKVLASLEASLVRQLMLMLSAAGA